MPQFIIIEMNIPMPIIMNHIMQAEPVRAPALTGRTVGRCMSGSAEGVSSIMRGSFAMLSLREGEDVELR